MIPLISLYISQRNKLTQPKNSRLDVRRTSFIKSFSNMTQETTKKTTHLEATTLNSSRSESSNSL